MGRLPYLGPLAALVLLTCAPTASAAVCTTASGCEFWDNDYHEYILYEVDTSSIDVLILPPATPFTTSDIAILEQSVDAWEVGIQALGASWFTSGIDIRHYTLGVDVPPASALQDPEIIIATAEYNPFVLFGIGLQSPVGVCTAQGGVASTLFKHSHTAASSVQAVQCESGGVQCVVLNTNFLLGGERRLYDLNAHEFGHCLGIGHVGDALDFDAKTVPLNDIMSYNDVPSQVHCVSTLNVRALEAVYAPLLGQPGGLAPGSYLTMSPSAYAQVACPNP
jgi:hypothetical protein